MRNVSVVARVTICSVVALGAMLVSGQAAADSFCATPAQAQQIRDFYRDNPGTMPAIASTRLKLPEALVVSGLPGAQSASAPGADFAGIWAAMGTWNEATFLIMKGANVFEVRSTVGKGAPSKTSKYFNIEYTQPVRGHLRPDQYESIYAVVLPGKDDAVVRGVLFFDAQGASVFGVFFSGDGPSPPASELPKFDAVMKLVRSRPAVCPGS